MPAQQGLWLEDDRLVDQGREQPVEAHEGQTIYSLQPGSGRRRPPQDDELLPQIEDLGFTSSLRAAQPRKQHREKSQDRDHLGESLSDRKAVDCLDKIFGRDNLIRDRDASYGQAVTKRLAAMGIRDHPTAPRSPWQNGHAERLIGSIRRECLDHIVVFGDAHLRRILADYAGYYNELRTHLSLDKDLPTHRPIQRFGQLAARPILGGLHHHYGRI